MFGEEIVKVTGNTSGHNYTIGDYYTISRIQAASSYLKLEAILPRISVQGIVLQGNGHNIQTNDFVRVDPFTDNEELVAFLKEKEAVDKGKDEFLAEKILEDFFNS